MHLLLSMGSICTLGILCLVLGTAVGDFHRYVVSVDKNSHSNQTNYTEIDSDACIRNLTYKIIKPPDRFTIEVIEGGKIIEAFQNDPLNLEKGKYYDVLLETTVVKKGTMICLTVFGRDSSVKVKFKTKTKSHCINDITTSTIISTVPYQYTTTIIEKPDHRNRWILLLLVAVLLALIVSVKYRKRILMMYRDIAVNDEVKQVTVIQEISTIHSQFDVVNPQQQHIEKCLSSPLRSTSTDIHDDYAELRTSDSNYAVPDIRISHVSISSYASFDDESTDDVRYHQPRHYSMSALSSQHYDQPKSNNNVSTTRSMNTLPIYPIAVQDYMSMGGSIPTLTNHYDRPSSSSHSLSETQFVRDQEDYVSMFTQEENYSNVGTKLGESFRNKKYVRKYEHKIDNK